MYKNRRYRSGALVPQSTQNRGQNQPLSPTKEIDENISVNNPVAVSSTVSSVSQSSQKYGNENVSPPKRAKISEQDEDMFTIPSSQNHPTQSRFSSQRSILARTQLILSIQRQPKNFFESTLIKCGVGLDVMDCYVLTCNHLNFVTKIRELLKTSDNYPANIKDFICGIDDAMKAYVSLTKLLSGCKLSLPSSDNIYQSQESIIKDFLMIDFLQKDLIEVLFKRIELFVVDDETLKLDVPYVELILSELKFVSLVEHGDLVLNNIFEIFESATVNYQQIIIRSLPDIVDVTKHNEAMEKLMVILPDDATLLGFSNVDTFGNMHLNASMRKRLRRKIIDHMMYKAPLDLFPSFVKFILRINSDEMEFLPQLLLDFRHCLHWVITEDNRNEVEMNQKEVFQCILRSLTTSKPLYDNWLKTIQSATMDNPEPIDFIILLLMIKVNEDKTHYIEQLIRKKIRSEQYNVKILEDIFKQFVSILTEYITIFISILDGFFRDKIPSIVSFACHGFNLLYSIEHCSNKVLLSKLVGYVCQNQLGSSFDVATNALRILTEFNDTNPVQMQNYGLQLLTMLDRASDLTLSQYRMVMNILGSLAFPVPPMTGSFELQNHIDMLLKKQVSSSILTIKNLGIVGIVQTIEHLIWTNATESSECNEVYESIDDIDDLAAKTAAQYLDLVLSATRNCPESLGLCFDELAAVISPKNKNQKKNLSVNKSFEIWVSDFIVCKFQELFVVGVVPQDDDVELIYQYSLNDAADNNTDSEDIVNIAINIGGLTFNPTSSALSAVSLLPSFFNLLRISQFHRYGNLITINALLGCAIVLPKCVNSPTEMNIFEDSDEVTAKRILDVYYLTVNWMRETISAFVTQEEKMLQKKTITRLSELIRLEEKIKCFLQIAPTNYVPPICQFNSLPNKQNHQKKSSGAQSRSTKATSVAINEINTESQNNTLYRTIHTQKSLAPNRLNTKAKMNFYSLSYGPKEIYRQMDPDIVRLLDQELLIKFPLPYKKIGDVLGLLEFKFLLDDLVIKLESVFGIKKFAADQQMQYVLSPSDLVSDLVTFLPQIMAFFIQLTNHLKESFDDAESGNDNSELYTEELNYTKICSGLCLRLFAAFFSWPNFELESNKNLLKESLLALTKGNDSEDDITISQLAEEAIDRIIHHSSTIWDLSSAVHMFHLTRSLSIYTNNSRSGERVVELCNEFLSRKWFGYDGAVERGGHCNVLLDELLKGLLKSANFKKLKDILQISMKEVTALCNKHDAMKTFPNFYKSNVALFYRSICTALIVALNVETAKSGPTTVQLKVWEKSVELLVALSQMLATLDIPRIYGIFLKHVNIYIKVFLNHGIPLIQNGLKSCCERIINFLKSLNNVTMFSHKICVHWKATQNAAIVAQVPFVRETIELLLIKVKAALAANNCSDAFWMANLKNKNLQDEEILTQTTNDSDDEDTNDELPDDDESLEEECLQQQPSEETIQRISKSNSSPSLLI